MTQQVMSKVILTEFINSAENSIRIFARSLNHEIYSNLELMYAIKKALDRKVHFDIMIQSEEPDEKSFRLVFLLEDSKYAELVSFEKKKGVGLNHNICIVDSNKFHFEYNPDERKAEASWNDEVTTRKLDSLTYRNLFVKNFLFERSFYFSFHEAGEDNSEKF